MIPLIDISGFTSTDPGARTAVVDAWRSALDTLGFVTISGHGIPTEVVQGIYTAASEFFDQPVASKLAWSSGGGGTVGYVRLLGENVSRTRGGGGHPDIAESLTFDAPAAADAMHNAAWPDLPADFREQVARYGHHAYGLGIRLMAMSALALGLPESYFLPYCSPLAHRLRLAYYPAQNHEPQPGQLRNAPHTDFAGFTILRQDDAPGGLQVLDKTGQWIDVPPTPGGLVINTGDLIQRWTNDRWISNVHRVVNPPRDHAGPTKRLSVVFFTGPRLDAEISCLPTCQAADNPPRYLPIRAEDHINLKLTETFGNPAQ